LIVLLSRLALAVLAGMVGEMLLVQRDRGLRLRRETRISRSRAFELLKFRILRREVKRDPRLAERQRKNLTWAGRRILKPRHLDEWLAARSRVLVACCGAQPRS
jgi:lipopolysaccharide/colanic/teichoic acid biosynthesis glycosyltransferase